MQEQPTNEDIEDIAVVNKDLKKADRMLRNESARARRKELKQVREIKLMNEWAKSRRARKSEK